MDRVKKKILFQTGGLPIHPVREQSLMVAAWLGNDFEVVAIDGTAVFDAMESADLFVAGALEWSGMPHLTWTEPRPYESPSAAQRKNFQEYVMSGRPILGFHAGVASYDDWKDYGLSLGFRWDWKTSSHLRVRDWDVVVKKTGHPIVEGLDDFYLEDELYVGLQMSDDLDYQVHASAQLEGASFPMVMTAKKGCCFEGAGRRAYLANGHHMKAFECSALSTLWRNTVHWLLEGSK